MNDNNQSQRPPFQRFHSVDSNHQGTSRILMTHTTISSNNSSPSGTSNLTDGMLQRRTAEGVLQLRDNLNRMLRGIQPLVETARSVNSGRPISLTNFLHRPAREENTISDSSNNANNNSFVINLENLVQENNAENNQNNNAQNSENDVPNANSENNIEADNNGTDRVVNGAETQQLLNLIQKYVPFVLILLTKGLYDHHEGILNFIVLFATFMKTNSVVKKEASKRTRRNVKNLFLAQFCIITYIMFIHYVFEEEHLFLNLIFIRSFEKPLNMWDLLWVVCMTDFMLKLITVIVKIGLTILPAKILAFQKRGKVYLFIEATSQLYRSLAPIQPWLYYLLESYQGPEKIVGMFLSAAYIVSKGADLMAKVKLMKTATFKLLQNMTVGSSPSKEEIQTAGEHCPICHDEYESPVLLHCRHIFCESCVMTWFDREQTCPLCRAKIVDDPSWRDGSTTFFIQLF